MARCGLLTVVLCLCIAWTANACGSDGGGGGGDGCRTVRRCYPMRQCTGVYPNLDCRVHQNCQDDRVCDGGSVYVKRSVSSYQEQQMENGDLSLATYTFFSLDLNNDGAIDLIDWTQQNGPEEDFFVADQDGDGKISNAELGEIPIKSIPGEYIRELTET